MSEPEKSDDDDDAESNSVSGEDRSGAAPLVRRAPDGRLLPGSVLNPRGRPKGSGARPRLVDLARDLADRHGFELEHAIGSVLGAMIKKAAAGDVDAARLVLGRITVDEAERGGPSIGVEVGPPMPHGEALASYLDDLRKVHGELTAASPRFRNADLGEALHLSADVVRMRSAADADGLDDLLG